MGYPDASSIARRPVEQSDIDGLFEQSRDEASVWMTAFTLDDPSDRRRFDTHMASVMASPTGVLRAIVRDGELVGSIASFVLDGRTEITYWVHRVAWGQGVASRALALFLDLVRERPLYARAASDNSASLRVLEKAGFQRVGVEVSFAPARRAEIEETVVRLAD